MSIDKRYRAQKLLGRGGMGEVYEAFDTKLGRPVALKVIINKLLGNALATKRFRREVLALASLNHPNVVRLFDCTQQKDKVFYTMELVDGNTLSSKLVDGPLDVREAVRLASSLADGLQAVHKKGLLHRDIKPANIMVTKDGTPKLMDFGLVKDVDETQTKLTVTGHIVGTLSYLPPEHLRHQRVDERSDVFQLGLILYESLTGKNPLTVEFLAAVSEGQREPTILPPSQLVESIDGRLDHIVMKAIASQPDSRYQCAAEFKKELDDWFFGVEEKPVEEPKKKRRHKGATREQSRRLRQIVVALAFIVGLLFLKQYYPGKKLGVVADLTVEGIGVKSILATWCSDWHDFSPCLVVRERGRKEALQTSLLVKLVKPVGKVDKKRLPFFNRVLLSGLQGGKDYSLTLKRDNGSETVAIDFQTLLDKPFNPNRLVSLTSDGSLEITAKSTIPFTATCTPNPIAVIPDDPQGRHDYRSRRLYRFSLRRLAVAPKTEMVLNSIDQQKVVWNLDVAKILSAELTKAYGAFIDEHKRGAFHRLLLGEERTYSTLFAKSKSRKFWPALTKRLVEQSNWYRQVRPFIPGIPTLFDCSFDGLEIRRALPLALLPLELIERAARSHKAPTNGQWQDCLSPRTDFYRVSRGPFNDGLLTQSLPFVWQTSRPHPWRLLIDGSHPRSKEINNPSSIYSKDELMELHVEKSSVLRSSAIELELSLRTLAPSAIPFVSINDTVFLYPSSEEELRLYSQSLSAKGRQALGGLGLSLSTGSVLDEEFLQSSLENTFSLKPIQRRVKIPADVLGECGTIIAQVGVFVGPVDSLGGTTVDGMKLVLHD